MRRLVFASLAPLAACSLMLEWSEDGLPCDDQKRCGAGFSCLGDTCVKDDSLEEGDTCSKAVQCAGDLLCTPYPYYGCRKACGDTYFLPNGNCAAGEYCRPYKDSAGELHAACVPDQCSDSSDCSRRNVLCPDCGAGMKCVPIDGSADACLVGCEVDFLTTGVYSDNCTSTPIDPTYCQPIGEQGMLVCLDAKNARLENQACEPVKDPCERGYVCQDGFCREYCNPAGSGSECAAANGCTMVGTSPDDFGYCNP